MSGDDTRYPPRRTELTDARDLPVRYGRPSLYTPMLEEELCRYLAEGLSIRHAAGLAGISENTVHRWRKWGREREARVRNGDPGPGDRRWVNFYRATEEARARAVATHVRHLNEAAPEDWRAAKAMLDRLDPLPKEVAGRPIPEPAGGDWSAHQILTDIQISLLKGEKLDEWLSAVARAIDRNAPPPTDVIDAEEAGEPSPPEPPPPIEPW